MSARAFAAEPLREQRCGSCGSPMLLSARASREAVRQERDHVCHPCRFPSVVVVTQPLLDWWTDRYEVEEIVEIAEGMWGPRSSWPTNPPQLRL